VTAEGGMTSHAMIIARSFGVPIVFGIDVDKELECGDVAIVDASGAKVIVAPEEKTEKYYAKKIANITKKKLVCEVKKDLHPQTKTGDRISLKVNISTPQEFDLVDALPIDGIGLLRTEFLFMERREPPSEDEQYELYKRALALCPDKPVTIRVLDIGSDKIPPFINIAVPETGSLDLSLRGALAVDAFEDLFITQMKALLRANVYGNLRLLYPMVSDFSDLYTYRAVLKKARSALAGAGSARKQLRVSEGIMIETPGAALLVDDLLKEVDFINIGSNDLLQYVLAAARGNLLVEERYHIVHPALLKTIELIVKAGKKAHKEVCLCGEIASFEEYYPLLLRIGIKSFSVSLGKFDAIKCEMLHFNKKQNPHIVEDFYKTRTKKEVDKYFAKFV
jgi:phosphoenolpyruvate-protein phosphotransferase (PTS system enzyme I)